MASKREQVLWKTVWPLAKNLERYFSLTSILSAGVVLFSKLTGDEQKEAIGQANALPHSGSSQKEALKNAVKVIKDMTEVERQQPGTIYRVLTADEQQIIDDFRRAISPKPKKTSKRKKTV